ncbi:hypothetical protein IFM89_013738 [Coptis chinensis]|uniref:Isopenicillin N synthase-like Fe(2+) 2OG dioxygenase domain-containing protein n=1 Tax=Coptis chinensis TaxID=261450 RepID=A0A835HXF2_9MAGN|nr:hypothetical protein IFM89_013738 [Coptis chinensis]
MEKRDHEQVEAEILEPYELHYTDLINLSSSSSSSSSKKEELERVDDVMQTLGPLGPGLLTITGVPKAAELRGILLPLARKLALINNDDRKRILKEHGLGSDVSLKNPERSASSFALQLKYVQSTSSDNDGDSSGEHSHVLDADSCHEFTDSEFMNLGSTFKELGICMMELGLHLARLCDRAIGEQTIEQSILNSSTAKGRLIHYHSTLDRLLLKEAAKRNGSGKKVARHPLTCHHGLGKSDVSEGVEGTPHRDSNLEHANEVRPCKTSLSNLWQQWHYDYGIFTILTAPMFTSPCDQPKTEEEEEEEEDGCWNCPERQHPSPSGHTYLQIFDSNNSKIFLVRYPPDSFIIQVGEWADIISQGKLHSTLHSVSRPVNLANLSRETFVVFLQPAWNETFAISKYHTKTTNTYRGVDSVSEFFSQHHPGKQPPKIYQKVQEIVPPLSSRLKDGMTFAEFSCETTKQYYGSRGTQR